jgi:hypothetical protein
MRPASPQDLDRILESAVIVSWLDLMTDTQAGRLHLEYAFASDNSLDGLQLWSSTVRGYWHLVGEYWMSSSTAHGQGLHLEDGFSSEGLAQTVDFIMQHQQAFVAPPNRGRHGVLQIQAPTNEESTAAGQSVREAFCRVNSFSAEPSIA